MEKEHHGHPDFRVGGKIFATLGYLSQAWAMVKLTPEQQQAFMQEEPEVFKPCSGAWGKRGATHVALSEAKEEVVRRALVDTRTNVAPGRIVEEFWADQAE